MYYFIRLLIWLKNGAPIWAYGSSIQLLRFNQQQVNWIFPHQSSTSITNLCTIFCIRLYSHLDDRCSIRVSDCVGCSGIIINGLSGTIPKPLQISQTFPFSQFSNHLYLLEQISHSVIPKTSYFHSRAKLFYRVDLGQVLRTEALKKKYTKF